MSLINDALKKAQRDRDPLAPTDALGAGGTARRRGRTPAQHWLIVLGSGALVLVVLSVALTLFWTTPDAPPRKAATVATGARPAVSTPMPAPAPAIVPVLPTARPAPAEAPAAAVGTPPASAPPTSAPAPTNSGPASSPASPEAPAPAGSTPSDPVAATPLARAAPTPAPAAPAALPVSPTPAPPPATPLRPDEKIAAYIGTLRIAGVRALGSDSRVLINERVYRVNEVIDRTLGIRLVQVEPGSLHFVDERGVTYVKYL